MSFRKHVLTWFVLLGAEAARSEEWIVVGPRAVGMGGAGVAVTRGPLATYWNPAAMAGMEDGARSVHSRLDVLTIALRQVVNTAIDLSVAQLSEQRQ